MYIHSILVKNIGKWKRRRWSKLQQAPTCFWISAAFCSVKRLNEMVNFTSGLLGISETSSDMRELLNHENQDIRAAEAVALVCYQVKKWIGAFAAALGGLDTLFSLAASERMHLRSVLGFAKG